MGSDRQHHVLLAGGGSGGHVFPALAVGEELGRRGHRVSFAGSPDGMEARLVPERGVDFHPLRSRPLVGRGAVGKVAALATLGLQSLSGARLVRRLGVAATLGTGGFASGPGVLGTRLAGRPALLLEPNARAGVANRQLSRFAAGAAVAFPQAAGELGCPSRTTGVPVRRAFFEVEERLPASDGLRILVLGGSQGAHTVNLALARTFGEPHRLLGRSEGWGGPPRVVHQTGEARIEDARQAYRSAGLGAALEDETVRLVPFIDDVAGAMAGSHLVVSRAGAITVSEIAAAGRPSVLVPLTLAGGHQGDNARAFGQAGAARVVEQAGDGPEVAEALSDALAGALEEMVAGGRGRLEEMARAARSLARPDAAGSIADWLIELADGSAGGGS